jgi:hypothetical protein
MAGTKNRVTRERFIEVNVQAQKDGKGIKWIAGELGLSEAYVAQRRTNLRTQGVPLPELSRGGGGAKVNLAETQALIAKLTGKSVEDLQKEGEELVKAAAERKAERDAAETKAE